jgi:RHS repeat-associated protein
MKTTLIRQRTGRLRKDVFTHNDRSELTAATMGDKAFAYDYDNIGNRKTAQEEANDFTYTANALNQYTEITENEVEFAPTFDADGNQTRIKTTTGIWTAVYNALNRPLTFTRENADGTMTVITADYDYMGRRVFKKVETVATDSETGEETRTVVSNHRFLYRGYLQIAALDLTRTTLNELWFITWDPTEPVATRPLAIQKDGTWYTYGLDLPKNITEIYGTDGYIKTAYTYSPYGLVTSTGSVTQPIQWSSEFTDTDLALVYYNYRHYNPLDGRWCGRDLAPSNNEYGYAKNQVLTSIDVYGNFAAILATPAVVGAGTLLPALGIAVAVIAVGAAAVYVGSVVAEAYDTWERETEQEEARKKRCRELRAKKQEYAKSGIEGASCKGLKPPVCPTESHCQLLADKIKKFEEAIKIRDEYDRVCFNGGDAGHKKQVVDLDNGLTKCRKYYEDCIRKLKGK